VDVKDSGSGLTVQEQAKLLRESMNINTSKASQFNRTQPLSIQSGGGGLPLWISRKIIKMHEVRLHYFPCEYVVSSYSNVAGAHLVVSMNIRVYYLQGNLGVRKGCGSTFFIELGSDF